MDPDSLLADLASLHSQITSLTASLLKLSTDNESARSQLAARIHSALRAADALAERADTLLLDPAASKDLSTRLYELKEDLKLDRSAYRKAQLASRKSTLARQRQERDLLFSSPRSSSSSSTPTPSQPRSLRAAEDATQSLRRTHTLLEAEIARSSLSLDVLDSSNATLRKLERQYSAFDVVLGASRKVIAVLEQADKWDRIYMLASLAFLLVVVTWVLWRRVLKGPVKLILWTAVHGGKAVSWAISRNSTDESISPSAFTSADDPLSPSLSPSPTPLRDEL
ncbi:Sec20-domain-containing protein [Myxozyma melibiosi]|uniref:Sec20-domain-containing protein n=1 Tax=Myxozyma melibiosi TaxID=54550 RepID=A0ABR1F020_9ASCO